MRVRTVRVRKARVKVQEHEQGSEGGRQAPERETQRVMKMGWDQEEVNKEVRVEVGGGEDARQVEREQHEMEEQGEG